MHSVSKYLMVVCFVMVSALVLGGEGIFSKTPGHGVSPPSAWAADEDYLSEPFTEPNIDTYDPLEKFNRTMFTFNDKLYYWFLRPVSKTYGKLFPEGFRICIRNAFDNLQFPVRFVNNTLQGKMTGAGIETGRFLINSTLGFAGMFDLADQYWDLKPYDEDFGQTLGFYGMKPMFFVIWPVLGPSTARDTIGMGADFFLDPIDYVGLEWWGRGAMRSGDILNSTSLRIGEYEDFKASALDPYVSMRDAYLNYRGKQISK